MGHIFYNMLLPPLLPALPALIQSAYQAQTRIGWDQLLCGRLARQWGIIIANHLHANHIQEKEMTALTWGRKFSSLVFELVLNLWQLRNTDGHMSTRQQDSQLTRDRLMDKILALQQSNPNISCQERAFIHRPVDTLQNYSLVNLQAWHKMALNIIQASRKRETHRHKRRRSPCGSTGDPRTNVS
jgi:hypothetical protein